jgi:hypothetical protein
VGRAIESHTDVYVGIRGKGTRAEARQLRRASVTVTDLANKAAEIAPAGVRSTWRDVAAIYAWMARSLSRTRMPGKVLLRLENSPVEWSAAQYEAASVIDFDAKERCGFDPVGVKNSDHPRDLRLRPNSPPASWASTGPPTARLGRLPAIHNG